MRSITRGILSYFFGRTGKQRIRAMRLFYRFRTTWMMKAAMPLQQFSRRKDIRICIDGVSAFSRIVRLIDRARSTVFVQMFIWKDDLTGLMVAGALLRAADRGVQVHITKEVMGDLFEVSGDFLSTRDATTPLWKRFWSHSNISIVHASEHDHTKAYVIDNEIVLLTGMNIADEYHFRWHDYLVELRGSRFAEQFLARRSRDDDANDSIRMIMNNESGHFIRPALRDLLHSAREQVLVEHCYFSDPETIDQLVALTKRGVQVTVVVPPHLEFFYYVNMRTIGQLQARCVPRLLRVLIYPGPFHSKMILVDGNRAFLGSANLMPSSLDQMGEVNVLISRRRALHQIREALRADILKSKPLKVWPGFFWIARWLAILGL